MKEQLIKIHKRIDDRIFLLETSVETQNRANPSPNTTYSLGLAYLSSTLEKEGYDVLIKDYATFDEESCLADIEDIIKEFEPKVIGISVMSMTRTSTYKTIKLIKRLDKNIKIILGGIHASVMYKQLLENFDIEAVIIGEGEETIIELLPLLLKNQNIKEVKGIAFKQHNEVIKNPERPLIHDVDNIPFPNHGEFMNEQRTKACMLSSRGCPNNCSFCCLQEIGRRRYRARSYMNVVDEIEYITKEFPNIKQIEFSDDTFTIDEERVINFCKEIIKRNIKLEFVCSARIKPASEKMFSLMEKIGFKEIRFGIETGSRKLLKSIHKNITPEEIIETFKIVSKFPKIKFVKFLMVGFPGENEETIKETIELTKKLQKLVPMDFFCAAPLWVYPGTEIYKDMKEKGQIDDSFWLSDKECPHYTVEYTKEELFNIANRISFETSLARGKIYFIKLVLKKMISNPKVYSKRMINFIIKNKITNNNSK